MCPYMYMEREGGGREREVNYKEFTDKSKFAGGPAGLGGSSVVPV